MGKLPIFTITNAGVGWWGQQRCIGMYVDKYMCTATAASSHAPPHPTPPHPAPTPPHPTPPRVLLPMVFCTAIPCGCPKPRPQCPTPPRKKGTRCAKGPPQRVLRVADVTANTVAGGGGGSQPGRRMNESPSEQPKYCQVRVLQPPLTWKAVGDGQPAWRMNE